LTLAIDVVNFAPPRVVAGGNFSSLAVAEEDNTFYRAWRRIKDHQSTWKTINEQNMNLENHELGTLTYWQHRLFSTEDACLYSHE
jgi:hypothetical protein